LRQRVESSLLKSARNQEVARTLGRRTRKQGSLDLVQTEPRAGGSQRLQKAMPDLEAALHHGPAQVVYAVAEPDGLFHHDVVLDRERRCACRIENPHLIRDELHFTRGQVGIDGIVGAALQMTAHGQDPLGANVLCAAVGFGCAVGLEDHLCDPGAIAQIHEDDAAVIAAPPNPTAQDDHLADLFGAYFAAELRAAQVSQRVELCHGVLAGGLSGPNGPHRVRRSLPTAPRTVKDSARIPGC
jgi:hypothetical protein